MSDYAIGPKLYGVFSAGRLEELVPVDYIDSCVAHL